MLKIEDVSHIMEQKKQLENQTNMTTIIDYFANKMIDTKRSISKIVSNLSNVDVKNSVSFHLTFIKSYASTITWITLNHRDKTPLLVKKGSPAVIMQRVVQSLKYVK